MSRTRRLRVRHYLFIAGALLLLPSAVLHLADALSRGLPPPLAAPASPAPDPIPSVRLHVHVHTDVSHDAVGERDEVARAARRAGVDGVWISDHLPRVPGPARFGPGEEDPWAAGGALPEGYPAPLPPEWVDDVLLVDGREFTVAPGVGRVLLFGGDTIFARWDGGMDPLLSLVASRPHAFLMVTHGRGPRDRDLWHAGAVPGVHGWEALTLSDGVRRRLAERSFPWRVPGILLAFVAGQGHRVQGWAMQKGGQDPGILAYDSLARGGPLAMVGAGNAHPKFRLFGALVPPYSASFRVLSTHVALTEPLPEDPHDAMATVHAALQAGRSWISVREGEEGRALRFVARSEGSEVEMGGVVGWDPELRLRVAVDPRPRRGGAVIRLLRDGEVVVEGVGWELESAAPGPGVYRVEVDRFWGRLGSLVMGRRLWLATSTIRVTPAMELDAEIR